MIEAWMLVVELVVLEILLVLTWRKYRVSAVGVIAASLVLPIAYYITSYMIIPSLEIEGARNLIRRGQFILFLILIIDFGYFVFKGK
jgi:hypothetical protein